MSEDTETGVIVISSDATSPEKVFTPTKRQVASVYRAPGCNQCTLVSRASPFPREGRVWSTSHRGFVSVCHDFLGVLTTNDAHRRVVARAVHAY